MHPSLPLPIILDPRCHGGKPACPRSVLITQQVSSAPASAAPSRAAEFISVAVGRAKGGCWGCKPPPHSPGHPVSRSGPHRCPQLPASPRGCTGHRSLCSVPGYSSRCKLGWDRSRLGVREARNGAETFPLIFFFFAAGLLNMRRSSRGCSGAAQRGAGCRVKAQSLLLRKRSFPAGLLFNCYKSKLSGPSSGNLFFFFPLKKKKAVSYVFLLTKA